MEVSQKSILPTKGKKWKKGKSQNWNLWGFYFLISLLPALILTIIFYLLGIKTLFWSERGTSRYPWVRGYVAVFLFLWFFLTILIVTLHIFLFLSKILLQKKNKNQQKKAGKYLLIFLSDQLIVNLLLALLYEKTGKGTAMLISFLLIIILNSFFIHYFFSKPAMRLLIEKYPNYFPKFFGRETKLIMKVDGMKFKKTKNYEWSVLITLILVDFWILLMLFLTRYIN